MNRIAASMRVDLLIASNDVVIAAERGDRLHVTPYRGKCERRAILSFLDCAGLKARAIVYSHETPTGPVGLDVKSGEPYSWIGA
ncbi:hypothetical protein KEX41_29735 (plasmid) [Burkholderia thailandensis]|uniref:hypothetical protein n=1 Tax=Burkholderia thailandensis TaxID=57975 RepID=UPI00192D31E7|nr:hypothetical protein [Burkholderia thailandensis]MBS2132366.1 hypothetical protein [Burkholderia thailandensis]QRA15171.1 hypothetical protein JMY07_30160 [Burkholderia thailandensis]